MLCASSKQERWKKSAPNSCRKYSIQFHDVSLCNTKCISQICVICQEIIAILASRYVDDTGNITYIIFFLLTQLSFVAWLSIIQNMHRNRSCIFAVMLSWNHTTLFTRILYESVRCFWIWNSLWSYGHLSCPSLNWSMGQFIFSALIW